MKQAARTPRTLAPQARDAEKVHGNVAKFLAKNQNISIL
jgi:hypothetical protein